MLTTHVIEDQSEFDELQDTMIPMYSILKTSRVTEWNNEGFCPTLSIALDVGENGMYDDFVRVAKDDSNTYCASAHSYLYAMDKIYLYCEYRFTKPAILNLRFLLPVEMFTEELTAIARMDTIGLGFVNRAIIEEVDEVGMNIITIPAIPIAACITACYLNTILKLYRDNPVVRTIIQSF